MIGASWLGGRVSSRWLCRGRRLGLEGRLFALDSSISAVRSAATVGNGNSVTEGENRVRGGNQGPRSGGDSARGRSGLETASRPRGHPTRDGGGSAGREGRRGPRRAQQRPVGPVGKALEEEGIEKAMKVMEAVGTTEAAKELLGCCRRNKSLSLTSANVWEIYERFVASRRSPERERVDVTLLGELALCQATHGDCSMGGRVWEEVEKHHIQPSAFLVSVLGRLFAKAPTHESLGRFLALLQRGGVSDSGQEERRDAGHMSSDVGEVRTKEIVGGSTVAASATEGKKASLHTAAKAFQWRPDLMDATNLMVGIGKLRDGDAALDVCDYIEDHKGELALDSRCFTAMIGMLSRCREKSAALDVLELMGEVGVRPNAFTMTALFSCLTAVKAPLEDFTYVRKAASEAGVLHEIPTINAMMDYYSSAGDSLRAIELMAEVVGRRESPNEITFTTALKACGLAGSLDHGREVEAMLERSAVRSNAKVLVSRLLMYTNCDDPSVVPDGHRIFERYARGEFTGMTKTTECNLFTAYIAFCTRYAAWDEGYEARRLSEEKSIPLSPTFANSLVRFYGQQGNKKQLAWLNAAISEGGLETTVELLTSLASALTSNGMLFECQKLQQTVKEKFDAEELSLDVELATALILMFRHTGPFTEISAVYEKMGHRRIKEKTVIALIRSAEKWNQPEFGAAVHRRLDQQTRGHISPTVRAALIDMYSACGRVAAAQDTFQTAVVHRVANIGCWTAIIKAFARQGEVEAAMLHFRQLLITGLQPQAETVLAMLEALCSQGMLDQACLLLDSLQAELKMRPNAQHRRAVTTALRAAGMVEKAEEVEAGCSRTE